MQASALNTRANPVRPALQICRRNTVVIVSRSLTPTFAFPRVALVFECVTHVYPIHEAHVQYICKVTYNRLGVILIVLYSLCAGYIRIQTSFRICNQNRLFFLKIY